MEVHLQLLLLTAKTWIFINRPMGEEQGSQIRIFANGQEIASGIGEMTLTPSAEQQETEAPMDWNNPPSFEITGIITNDGQVAELINDIIRRSKFNRKELRKMFHAVTHGGAIVFQSYFNAEYDNGETEEFVRNVYINRPRILRKMIAANRRFRFKYDIVPHFDPKDKIILSEFEQ